jgi:hypothetical protein
LPGRLGPSPSLKPDLPRDLVGIFRFPGIFPDLSGNLAGIFRRLPRALLGIVGFSEALEDDGVASGPRH